MKHSLPARPILRILLRIQYLPQKAPERITLLRRLPELILRLQIQFFMWKMDRQLLRQ